MLRQSTGLRLAPFGLALLFTLGASPIGPQDATSVVVQQSAVPLIAGDVTGAAEIEPAEPALGEPMRQRRGLSTSPAFIDRGRKGDLLIPRIQIELAAELMREDAGAPAPPQDELHAAIRFKPFAAYDPALSLELNPQLPREPAENGAGEPGEDVATADARESEALFGAGRLYFDAGPLGVALTAIEPWEPGQAPTLVAPAPPARVASAPLAADAPDAPQSARAERADERPRSDAAGSIIPAVRLGLAGKARAKAERCLANAVYFESRSEPVRGQIAVAQVVLNRAFSGYYPDDVCGVVYQGAYRHLSCQFTFACDGIPDVVTEPEHWQRAMRIAKAALDGRIWLADVGKATHYHASYVYPYWVRSMRKLKKIGLHTFYRPRKWGDGSDEPSWGSAAGAEIAANL